ncbi:TPA: hypothetical protein I8627_002875 [Citrobacter freundii]|nr:hypothetical protein [Citrobacter freundii]
MTALNKQALRERYSSQPVPKCHICGAEMTVQRMSASRITYGCTGATYDDKGCHYAEGRSIADDHYEQSRVTVVDVSDPEVLALLDELEESQALGANESACADSTINLAINWQMRCKDAEAKLEASEKRIAELEARAFNPAILDVIAERQRQQSVEGWTPEHDNAYQNSELADAAACYAIHAHNQGFSTPAHWPWSPDWWKQSGARRDLVKAGALILAEIERIDRAAGIGVKGE